MKPPELDRFLVLYKNNTGAYQQTSSWTCVREFQRDARLAYIPEFQRDPAMPEPAQKREFQADPLLHPNNSKNPAVAQHPNTPLEGVRDSLNSVISERSEHSTEATDSTTYSENPAIAPAPNTPL